ncbi:hypothetical protein CKAN_00022300 [Cinnamomum micranthum f. kanehirae]|uniref:Uncharacterized protein n=1 Tax=Cinnamomum micranthum f. kanehirae TaxID=337451 RepID=A0A3S4N2Q7_9MAGN|nr:hypothetical protein CKAN_00022300 [Cinnamomum micranthum f. kanehirae]
MESYEECHHPPRLFDNDNADICLKRYLDPSFLKMACSRSELMKPKICGEKNDAPESKVNSIIIK